MARNLAPSWLQESAPRAFRVSASPPLPKNSLIMAPKKGTKRAAAAEAPMWGLLALHASVCVSVCLPLFACLLTCLSVCWLACLFICLLARLLVCLLASLLALLPACLACLPAASLLAHWLAFFLLLFSRLLACLPVVACPW